MKYLITLILFEKRGKVLIMMFKLQIMKNY